MAVSINPVTVGYIAVVPVLISLGLMYLTNGRWRHSNLPPGPRGLPIIGNIKDVAPNGRHEYQIYSDLAEKYGDVFYLEKFGKPVMVLNSMTATVELMEKKSSIYSDKPTMYMSDMLGWFWTLLNMRYDDKWRAHRRKFEQYFRQSGSPDHLPAQLKATSHLLQALNDVPEDKIKEKIWTWGGEVMLDVVFGYSKPEFATIYTGLVMKALYPFFVINPAVAAVNFIPFLRHLPTWLPGMGWKKQALEWSQPVFALKDKPFEMTRDAILGADKTEVYQNSFVAKGVAEIGLTKGAAEKAELEDIIKNCAGTGYVAGSDTIISSLHVFFHAMTRNPEVQAKAQAEIDSVTGGSRLPTLEDRPKMPYIDALLTEVFRILPTAPLGSAHATSSDDVYRGWYIPKGTTVVTNIRAICFDPKNYPNPTEFQPERYLGAKKQPDPANFAFGHGRRVCAAKNFAGRTIWLAIAAVLSTYSISPPKDKDGKPIIPTTEHTPGAFSHPLPFNCVVKPRGPHAAELISTGYGVQLTASH